MKALNTYFSFGLMLYLIFAINPHIAKWMETYTPAGLEFLFEYHLYTALSIFLVITLVYVLVYMPINFVINLISRSKSGEKR